MRRGVELCTGQWAGLVAREQSLLHRNARSREEGEGREERSAAIRSTRQFLRGSPTLRCR